MAEPRGDNAVPGRAKPRGLLKSCRRARTIRVPDCLVSLRPSERARASHEVSEVECGSEVERSETGESVIVRRPNSADAWRAASWWATRGAAASGERSASVGSVRPGCFPFKTRSVSDEQFHADIAR